jgi:hypothetical protein
MRRFFPRDVLLIARLLAVAGALAWILIGGQATLWLSLIHKSEPTRRTPI